MLNMAKVSHNEIIVFTSNPREPKPQTTDCAVSFMMYLT